MQLVEPATFRANQLADRLARVRTVYLLAPIVLVSWGVTLWFALHVKHNGWLYYNGGDSTFYWTTAWALGHHLLPTTGISYALPVFQWPLTLILGPIELIGLIPIVLFQVIVLGALAVIGMYGIGSRLGGRLFGVYAAFAWAISPVIADLFFYPRVRPTYGAVALSGVLGLNNLADYPSLVFCILVAWLVLRVLDERRWNDVVLAGILCGFLVAIKPSNGFFVPAPILALFVARRWRETGGFIAAMIPALVTLAIWKQAGLGHIPLLGAAATHDAAGTSASGAIGGRVTHYLPFSWHTFSLNLSEIREYGWSLRLAEWIPIAGIIGVWRRGAPQAILVALWCLDYLVVKGGTNASVYSWSYFRFTMPGFPAYVLLACAVVFLIPRLGRRWRPNVAQAVPLRWSRGLLAAIVVLAVYPLLFVLAHGKEAGDHVVYNQENALATLTSDMHVHVVQTPAGPSLRWHAIDTGPSRASYAIYKTDLIPDCRPDGTRCLLLEQPFRLVHALNFPAWQFGKGIYRVGLVAGPHISRNDGDLMTISPPVNVR